MSGRRSLSRAAKGKTRGALTREALLLLLKPKRIQLSEAKRKELAREQLTCYICNEPLGEDYEIDHKQ